MIRHIVMWKFREGEEENREKFLSGLQALDGVIPEIRHMEIHRSCKPGNPYDACLIADFDDLDALDRYTAQFTLVGGGGTDFRPAFARIAQLRQDGALRDLQGVLYFTDGKGIYPAKRPPFETAFLFLEDGTPPPDVPPWAMRLVLQPEEFDPKGR